jgi:hypothetical protein
MLSVDLSRKEGNRESTLKKDTGSSKKISSSSTNAKPKTDAKSGGTEESSDKTKAAKRSSEKTSDTSKTVSRRKSTTEKSSSGSKDKKTTNGAGTSSDDKKKAGSSPASKARERPDTHRRPRLAVYRGFSRGRGGYRGGRDLPHMTQGGLRVRPRSTFAPPERRDFHSRRHPSHGRDLIERSPPRPHYHRPAVEPRRGGRQPELSFEDIYVIIIIYFVF